VVWAGSKLHPNDRNRSFSLATLEPVLGAKNVTFFSLQFGPASDELRRSPHAKNIIDLSPDIHDFADTAAVIAQLDLLISADTAAVHVAGALGKPVWTLIPFAPDWRWMLGRSDTPWYPTMTLFRQPHPGDWTPPVREITNRLPSFLT
jgi:ADP-heptose:LPS heptosyltransferase